MMQLNFYPNSDAVTPHSAEKQVMRSQNYFFCKSCQKPANKFPRLPADFRLPSNKETFIMIKPVSDQCVKQSNFEKTTAPLLDRIKPMSEQLVS